MTGTRRLSRSGTGTGNTDGAVVHVGGPPGQAVQSPDSTGRVPSRAGYEWSDVVRLSRSIEASRPEGSRRTARQPSLRRAHAEGCRAGGVLLGVQTPALPGMRCELRAMGGR